MFSVKIYHHNIISNIAYDISVFTMTKYQNNIYIIQRSRDQSYIHAYAFILL